MDPNVRLGTTLAELFRPRPAPGESDAYRQRMSENVRMGQEQTQLGTMLAQRQIQEAKSRAYDFDRIKAAEMAAGVPEAEAERKALYLTGGFTNINAISQATARDREMRLGDEAAAIARERYGADNPNVPLFGLSKGPQTMGAPMGQGYNVVDRFAPATGDNLQQNPLGSALVAKTAADQARLMAAREAQMAMGRERDARADVSRRTDPNRPRSSGAAPKPSAATDPRLRDAEAIRALYKSGAISREDAAARIKALGL